VSIDRSNAGLAGSLVIAVLLWGASNVGTKFLVAHWPPILTGASRFLLAGLFLHALLAWAGKVRPLRDFEPWVGRALWFRSGLVLALYIVIFNWTLRLIPVSHVALYLGAAPVWAALWEQGFSRNRAALIRYAAAFIALAGVVILFLPSLRGGAASWYGEAMGLACSFIWTWYGHECRHLGTKLSGAEITAHTMWRAGLLLMAPGLLELRSSSMPISITLLLVQGYCIICGGVIAYWLWNHALRCWPTSRVYLFNNLIPISTMIWAHFTLGEPITPTFGLAMVFIIVGVVLGQGIGSGCPGGPLVWNNRQQSTSLKQD
jgi:drug/metabolite transporter (DMT)-like permease